MEPVVRYRVPCVSLSKLLRRTLPPGPSPGAGGEGKIDGRRGVDVFWLDCEGCELDALHSLRLDEGQISVGLLVVEMRWDDRARNRAIFALLRDAGFELLRALKASCAKSCTSPSVLPDPTSPPTLHY